MYVSNDRVGGNVKRYIGFFDDTQLAFDLVPQVCIEEARLVLCQYFLPPCGNSTVFEPPKSVCGGVCDHLRSLCSEEYDKIKAYFDSRSDLVDLGFTMINCSNTGQYLDFPHCCSDLDIEIRKCNA